MKRLILFLAGVLLVSMLGAGTAMAAKGGPGCVDGGKGFVGEVPAAGGLILNWHGTYIISLCPGATGPQAGDSNVQQLRYPDGTTEKYKIVYSTKDLTPNGVFCYWDLTLDPTLTGSGYHCPDGSDDGHLYWYIVSSSGDSPFLEPAGSGGTSSRPNGRGVYK